MLNVISRTLLSIWTSVASIRLDYCALLSFSNRSIIQKSTGYKCTSFSVSHRVIDLYRLCFSPAWMLLNFAKLCRYFHFRPCFWKNHMSALLCSPLLLESVFMNPTLRGSFSLGVMHATHIITSVLLHYYCISLALIHLADTRYNRFLFRNIF